MIKHITICIAAIVALTLSTYALAGHQTAISKNSDFSTEDRVFSRDDILYVRVTDAALDYTDIDKNEFRLKPEDGGEDIEISLHNLLNGTYEAEVDLSVVDRSESNWEVRVRLEDEGGRKFESRTDIIIQGALDDNDDDDHDDNDEVEFTGKINAITVSNVTVGDVTFLVDDNTVVLDDDNNPIDFNALGIDQTVQIRGERNVDGQLVANRIKIEMDDFLDDEIELTGRIAAIDANSIRVSDTEFELNDATMILDNDGNTILLSDLRIGDLVEVRADILGDGTVSTTRIKLEDDAFDEIELTGTIEAIGADTLVVAGMTFRVDGSTQIFDDDDEVVIAFASLQIGQVVELKAVVQSNKFFWQ